MGYDRHGLVLRAGQLSIRLDRRNVATTLILASLVLVVAIMALGSGDRAISPGDVLRALIGEAAPRIRIPVVEWRLPRILLGAMAGAALGIGGAIFQSLSRNPLGSPDIIGFNTGAVTGALVAMLVLDGDYYHRAAGSLAGGTITALAVYLMAYRRGQQSFRLILIGIGISAMLASLNSVLIHHAELQKAMQASIWQVGSLSTAGWPQVGHLASALAIIAPLALAASRVMRILELGDDKAASLGLPVQAVRALLLAVGVSLTAATVAAVGPIAFIALAAPQLALRCTGFSGLALLPSAAMGSLLLITSDWAGQRLIAPTQVPVGIVTLCIGGAYLAWLLARPQRKTGD